MNKPQAYVNCACVNGEGLSGLESLGALRRKK